MEDRKAVKSPQVSAYARRHRPKEKVFDRLWMDAKRREEKKRNRIDLF